MVTRRFKTGEEIPASGVYRTFHAAHRLPHEVTLLKAHAFPRCSACGDAVEFEALHLADTEFDTRGRITLHALPEVGDGAAD